MVAKVQYSVVDAFTTQPFGGNPAAVCFLGQDDHLSQEQMQLVAAEMNLPDTAFVQATSDPHTFNLQWFSPNQEVALCGHASLATTSILFSQGYKPNTLTQQYNFVTRFSGTLSGGVVPRSSNEPSMYELDFPEDYPTLLEDGSERTTIAAAVMASVAPGTLRVQKIWKGKFDAVVEIDMFEGRSLADLAVDVSALAPLPYRGTVFTTVLASPSSSSATGPSFHSRFFGPSSGIPEDPVTGSLHCLLAPLYTQKFKLDSGTELWGSQGGKRRGEIRVVWDKAAGRVKLRGNTCFVAQGELSLSHPSSSSQAESGSRGMFIVLEGLDRTGKSTQVANLLDQFKAEGLKARGQKFPDRTTPIGIMIDSYLKSATEMDDSAIHLLFSANRWECATQIEKDLSAGISVIADRYAFSGIAFSAAKGLPPSWLLQPDKNLPAPDLTIFLTLSPEAAATRGSYGEERYETTAIQTRVRKEFEAVATQVKKFQGRSGKWEVVSAEGTVEEVAARVWQVVKAENLQTKGAVKRLWI